MPHSGTRPFVQDVVLPYYPHLHHRTALADFLVVLEVEGAVFPDGGGGGVVFGVGVVGFGVHGEEDPAFAVGTIVFDADALEAVLSSRDADFAGDDFCADEVGAGGFGAFDVKGVADGFGVGGVNCRAIEWLGVY